MGCLRQQTEHVPERPKTSYMLEANPGIWKHMTNELHFKSCIDAPRKRHHHSLLLIWQSLIEVLPGT